MNAIEHPRVAAALVAVFVFLVPAAAACFLHVREVSKKFPQLRKLEMFRIYNPTPTAWDHAVNRAVPGYVRVLTKDGNWVGGYAGTVSFFTNYPQSREIFVETAWILSKNGEFQSAVEGSVGQWINCNEATVVEFLSTQ